MKRSGLSTLTAILMSTLALPAPAAFTGTDVFLPSVGRGPGSAGSEWYTCVWVHNPGATPANVQFRLLLRNQPNPSAQVYNDTIPPGDTRRYDNAVETMFGESSFGALRVTSSQKLMVSSRIYSLTDGAADRDSVGQLFAAIPASFAIGVGQSTTLLGTYQTSPEDGSQFRANFGFVETTGATAKVRVTAFDESGTSVGSAIYTLAAWEAQQHKITELLPGVDATNLRLLFEVPTGPGRVAVFGSGIANGSNDPSTFEMSFRDDLLAENASGGGTITGVTAGAGLSGGGTSGTVTLAVGAGQGIQVGADLVALADGGVTKPKLSASGGTSGQLLSTNGSSLQWIDPPGGSGSGDITAVTAGAGLSGGGTSGDVSLAVANGGIASAMLADAAVTTTKLSASGGSSGKVLKLEGSALVWGDDKIGGLTLPFDGSLNSSTPLFAISNTGSGIGVHGGATNGTGVRGSSGAGYGVLGDTSSGIGVVGVSSSGTGVSGGSSHGTGVYGISTDSRGVWGDSSHGDGVYGSSASGFGGRFRGNIMVTSYGNDDGLIYSDPDAAGSDLGLMSNDRVWVDLDDDNNSSGSFFQVRAGNDTEVFRVDESGNAKVLGTLTKGGGSFKIDHPLDPENRYLYHSFVESPDMMNIYNGNVVTDERGYATVVLPDWFEALNRDFRYQLTVIGEFAQAIVAQKIEGDQFVIRTDKPAIEVSWQVTGIRHDAFANANRIPVEEDKPEAERGHYLHAEAFGRPPMSVIEPSQR